MLFLLNWVKVFLNWVFFYSIRDLQLRQRDSQLRHKFTTPADVCFSSFSKALLTECPNYSLYLLRLLVIYIWLIDLFKETIFYCLNIKIKGKKLRDFRVGFFRLVWNLYWSVYIECSYTLRQLNISITCLRTYNPCWSGKNTINIFFCISAGVVKNEVMMWIMCILRKCTLHGLPAPLHGLIA